MWQFKDEVWGSGRSLGHCPTFQAHTHSTQGASEDSRERMGRAEAAWEVDALTNK